MNDISISFVNLLLGLECIALLYYFFKKKISSVLKYDFIFILMAVALASFLSVAMHFLTLNIETQLILWKGILLSVGLVSLFIFTLSVGLIHYKYHKISYGVFFIITLLYGMAVVKWPHYELATIYYIIAALFLFYALRLGYKQTKHRQMRFGSYAIVLVLIAPLFQESIFRLGQVSGNIIYSLCMLGAMYFCYLAINAGLQKHSINGFNDVYVTDIHSRINETLVQNIYYPSTQSEVINIIKEAQQNLKKISICGSRHAMGGQQFSEHSLLIDTSKMKKVLDFNQEEGKISVEAGITWPQFLNYLYKAQKNSTRFWTISQKQTGADDLTLGGGASANIHGRGLTFRPFIQDIISITLIDAQGNIRLLSRTQEVELFSLVIGGYGLFGVIYSLEIQLVLRQVLQRKVEVIPVDILATKFQERVHDGYLYGDFQYKTNDKSSDYLKTGVFSCYKPILGVLPSNENKFLNSDDWNKLLLLAHIDKERAFKKYSEYYLTSDGQCYWSDTHQLSFYNDKYVELIRSFFPDFREGSLMITELYVPLDRVNEFMDNVANDDLLRNMDLIYGTVRLIKADNESFLAWARKDFACIIFNLNITHSSSGYQFAELYFTRLIDHALALDGSFFLTYHRWARKDQILKAYPQFTEFLKLKLKYDPEELFQSTWYQYYKRLIITP